MKFRHRDGEDAAARISLGVRDKADIVDGEFEVDPGRDDYDELAERLVELGHEPIDDTDEGGDGDGGETEGAPPASAFGETEIVEMGYRDKQAIASRYDHIPGNASSDELTESLIEQRREEVDG